MGRRKLRGLLFDKDGTLIEFDATWHPIMETCLRRLEELFEPSPGLQRSLRSELGILARGFSKDSIVRHLPTSTLAAIMAKRLVEDGVDVAAAQVEAILNQAATAPEGRPQLVPGIRTFLRHLKSRGISLGIATADSRASTVCGLAKVGILEYFDFLAADGDGYPAKPHPAAAWEFCRSHGLAPEEVLVIGDSPWDLRFAQAAGTNFIGRAPGLRGPDAFYQAHCPVIRDYRRRGELEGLIA